MKILKNLAYHLLLIGTVSFATGCKDEPKEPLLVGQDGNPRFNLQFTNPDGVDLDLYVQDTNGEIIYYSNKFSRSGGSLDVDCRCESCPNGPNENIFWLDGKAPKGVYKYWVEYYDYCKNPDDASEFTLRLIQNGKIIATQKGRLINGKSQVWTHEQK